MAIAADSYAGATPIERQPGQFARHPKTGAPYVAHPTKTSKRTGTKAELLAECARLGIDWRSDLDIDPRKTPTVAQLHELLGPRPSMVQYGRPSSLGKQIENMTNIQKWSERAVALGLFLDWATSSDGGRSLLVGELLDLDWEQWNLDDDQARDVLDAIAVKAKNLAQAGLAADRGTHVHERTEDHDTERDWIEAANRGEDLGLAVEVQAALVRAWTTMLDEYDLEVLTVEASCVDDRWRQAGTLDRIARLRRDLTFILPTGEKVTIPAGTVLILDIKTGKLRLDRSGFVSYWHGYSVQLASYAQSLPYDPDTDTRGEWEWPIDQQWAIIAHLDVLAALDGEAVCRLVLVDLAAGREAGERCVWSREWEKRTDVFSLPLDDLAVRVTVEAAQIDQDAQHPAAAPAAGEALAPSPAAPLAAPSPAEVEQPATGEVTPNASPVAVSPDERRSALLGRYQALSDDDKRRYLELDVDRDDLDAVEAAINAVDPFAQTAERVPLAPDVEPEFDEGRQLADRDAVAHLVATIAGSGAARRATCNAWLKQGAGAGAPWNPRQSGTVANFERARAAHALSVWVDADLDGPDEVVRAVLAVALGTDAAEHPAIPVGVVIGRLTVTEARQIVATCERIDAAEVVLTFSTDGPPRFVDRAAAPAA